MTGSKEPQLFSSAPVIRVIVNAAAGDQREFRFERLFRIGRLEDCDVCIQDQHVSRQHVEVRFEDGQWRVRDLRSSNGVFIGTERIEDVPVPGALTMRLGINGPLVSLEIEPAPAKQNPRTDSDAANVADYVARYFEQAGDEPVGEHTMMVRRAFKQVQTRQRLKYGRVLAILIFCLLAVGTFAIYEHQRATHQRALTQDMFYAMKALEVANVERLSHENGPDAMEQIRIDQKRRQDIEKNYEQSLARLHLDSQLTERDRLVVRIARIFGECELNIPPDFKIEIDNYIKQWQSSGRLAKAVRLAQDKGYTVTIQRELLAQGLPPQFFYIALQESDFNIFASGPMTRKGIAKGMWQFIPETAGHYGLRVGPRQFESGPDPNDDRDRPDLATRAAARYLKDLYATDAQASGLLVMACYNWGEDNVLPLIRRMPANPRDRNFWRLLTGYRDKVPKETYGYVFSIASAAVIGENPRLFGFDFENPLANLDGK